VPARIERISAPTAAFRSRWPGAARSADDVDVGAGADRPCALVRARRRWQPDWRGRWRRRRPAVVHERVREWGRGCRCCERSGRHRRDRYKKQHCYRLLAWPAVAYLGRLSYAMTSGTGRCRWWTARYSWWDLSWLGTPVRALVLTILTVRSRLCRTTSSRRRFDTAVRHGCSVLADVVFVPLAWARYPDQQHGCAPQAGAALGSVTRTIVLVGDSVPHACPGSGKSRCARRLRRDLGNAGELSGNRCHRRRRSCRRRHNCGALIVPARQATAATMTGCRQLPALPRSRRSRRAQRLLPDPGQGVVGQSRRRARCRVTLRGPHRLAEAQPSADQEYRATASGTNTNVRRGLSSRAAPPYRIGVSTKWYDRDANATVRIVQHESANRGASQIRSHQL